jgi:hypothetical protein
MNLSGPARRILNASIARDDREARMRKGSKTPSKTHKVREKSNSIQPESLSLQSKLGVIEEVTGDEVSESPIKRTQLQPKSSKTLSPFQQPNEKVKRRPKKNCKKPKCMATWERQRKGADPFQMLVDARPTERKNIASGGSAPDDYYFDQYKFETALKSKNTKLPRNMESETKMRVTISNKPITGSGVRGTSNNRSNHVGAGNKGDEVQDANAALQMGVSKPARPQNVWSWGPHLAKLNSSVKYNANDSTPMNNSQNQIDTMTLKPQQSSVIAMSMQVSASGKSKRCIRREKQRKRRGLAPVGSRKQIKTQANAVPHQSEENQLTTKSHSTNMDFTSNNVCDPMSTECGSQKSNVKSTKDNTPNNQPYNHNTLTEGSPKDMSVPDDKSESRVNCLSKPKDDSGHSLDNGTNAQPPNRTNNTVDAYAAIGNKTGSKTQKAKHWFAIDSNDLQQIALTSTTLSNTDEVLAERLDVMACDTAPQSPMEPDSEEEASFTPGNHVRVRCVASPTQQHSHLSRERVTIDRLMDVDLSFQIRNSATDVGLMHSSAVLMSSEVAFVSSQPPGLTKIKPTNTQLEHNGNKRSAHAHTALESEDICSQVMSGHEHTEPEFSIAEAITVQIEDEVKETTEHPSSAIRYNHSMDSAHHSLSMVFGINDHGLRSDSDRDSESIAANNYSVDHEVNEFHLQSQSRHNSVNAAVDGNLGNVIAQRSAMSSLLNNLADRVASFMETEYKAESIPKGSVDLQQEINRSPSSLSEAFAELESTANLSVVVSSKTHIPIYVKPEIQSPVVSCEIHTPIDVKPEIKSLTSLQTALHEHFVIYPPLTRGSLLTQFPITRRECKTTADNQLIYAPNAGYRTSEAISSLRVGALSMNAHKIEIYGSACLEIVTKGLRIWFDRRDCKQGETQRQRIYYLAKSYIGDGDDTVMSPSCVVMNTADYLRQSTPSQRKFIKESVLCTENHFKYSVANKLAKHHQQRAVKVAGDVTQLRKRHNANVQALQSYVAFENWGVAKDALKLPWLERLDSKEPSWIYGDDQQNETSDCTAQCFTSIDCSTKEYNDHDIALSDESREEESEYESADTTNSAPSTIELCVSDEDGKLMIRDTMIHVKSQIEYCENSSDKCESQSVEFSDKSETRIDSHIKSRSATYKTLKPKYQKIVSERLPRKEKIELIRTGQCGHRAKKQKPADKPIKIAEPKENKLRLALATKGAEANRIANDNLGKAEKEKPNAFAELKAMEGKQVSRLQLNLAIARAKVSRKHGHEYSGQMVGVVRLIFVGQQTGFGDIVLDVRRKHLGSVMSDTASHMASGNLKETAAKVLEHINKPNSGVYMKVRGKALLSNKHWNSITWRTFLHKMHKGWNEQSDVILPEVDILISGRVCGGMISRNDHSHTAHVSDYRVKNSLQLGDFFAKCTLAYDNMFASMEAARLPVAVSQIVHSYYSGQVRPGGKAVSSEITTKCVAGNKILASYADWQTETSAYVGDNTPSWPENAHTNCLYFNRHRSELAKACGMNFEMYTYVVCNCGCCPAGLSIGNVEQFIPKCTYFGEPDSYQDGSKSAMMLTYQSLAMGLHAIPVDIKGGYVNGVLLTSRVRLVPIPKFVAWFAKSNSQICDVLTSMRKFRMSEYDIQFAYLRMNVLNIAYGTIKSNETTYYERYSDSDESDDEHYHRDLGMLEWNAYYCWKNMVAERGTMRDLGVLQLSELLLKKLTTLFSMNEIGIRKADEDTHMYLLNRFVGRYLTNLVDVEDISLSDREAEAMNDMRSGKYYKMVRRENKVGAD